MSEPDRQPEPDNRSFAESVLPKAFFEDSYVKRFLALSPTAQVVSIVAVLAGLVLIPFLGSVGLWDPWETHYGEVARNMIQRGDYVYPYWENGWFFSKPAMTMWLMALGMNIVGTNEAPTYLALGTEWGMRLPFVLLSITAVVLLSLAVSRTVNKRAGLATGFVLVTMPTWFLISRQAVTDTPFVCSFVAAMACAIIGQLDRHTKHRAAWWYAFYVFSGIATLAKGVIGVGFPAVILLIYAGLSVIPWTGKALGSHLDWLTKRALVPLLGWGGTAVVAAGIAWGLIGQIRPTESGDPQRIANAVLAALVGFLVGLGVFLVLLRRKVPQNDEMPVLWAQFFKMRLGTGILVFFAVALPWYFTLTLFDQVGNAEEGQLFWFRFFVHDQINRLAVGVHTTTPGGTFTYFIEQGGFGIFPWVALVPGAFALVSRLRLRSSDTAEHVGVMAAVWVAFTFTLLGSSSTKFHHYVFPILPGVAVLIALFIDRLWREGISKNALALVFGFVLLVLVGHDLVKTPKHFTDLFVYNYDRPYPIDLWTRNIHFAGLALNVGSSPTTLVPPFNLPFNLTQAFGFALTGAVIVFAGSALMRDRRMLFGSFVAATLSFTLWFNWNHWVDLSHHWTQRDLFWRYYELRKPDEPITAFLMNWRGETFYSRNHVKQIKDNARLAQYASLPGRKWALVEHNRLGILKSAVGAGHTVTVVTQPEMNNKFLLVSID